MVHFQCKSYFQYRMWKKCCVAIYLAYNQCEKSLCSLQREKGDSGKYHYWEVRCYNKIACGFSISFFSSLLVHRVPVSSSVLLSCIIFMTQLDLDAHKTERSAIWTLAFCSCSSCSLLEFFVLSSMMVRCKENGHCTLDARLILTLKTELKTGMWK